MLKEKNIQFNFNIYGKGEYLNELQRLIQDYDLGREVRYMGMFQLTDMPNEIMKADFGIVSYEKSKATDLMLPLKLMEYVAMQIPVITIKNKAISHYFDDEDLIYYGYKDHIDLFNKIIYVYSNMESLNRFKQNYHRNTENFNWEIEKKNYIDLIDSL